MSRQIRLNAFAMNCICHQSPGLWAHPRDRSTEYASVHHWLDLARLLERGLFDGLFLADVLGVYDVYGGKPDAAIRHAIQVPVNDPALLVPAMAGVTQHLGFGITSNLSYEAPYVLARRFSTLDHLTGGRVGWNIVTGYLDSAARGVGLKSQLTHDRRYDMAEEYMEVVYRLWEESWQPDAVLADRARRIYADPAKVHRIRHEGEFFSVDAIHLAEPSPQRTPVLYQAGASGRGKQFAARHAECVFINGPSQGVVQRYVKDIRGLAEAVGRRGSDLRIFTLVTAIVGRTDQEAREKLADYRRFIDREASLALLSGWTGIDLSRYSPDDPLTHLKTEAMVSAVESFTTADPNKTWTIGALAEHVAIGGRGPVLVGSPKTVADQLVAWFEATGVDGFNVAYAVFPESFSDLVDLVIPELQARGLYKEGYAPGPLRQKLFGAGAELNDRHPGRQYRRSEAAE
jgi:alkanesulfonate monooxygenase